MLDDPPSPPVTIDSTELQRLLTGTSPPVVVAVMSLEQYRRGHVPGARRLGRLPTTLDGVACDHPIVISCRDTDPVTTSWALHLLWEHGFRTVSVHEGGLAAWEEAGLDVERER